MLITEDDTFSAKSARDDLYKDIPGSSGGKQNGTVYRGARYIEVHLSYNIHGWGIITVPVISRFTVSIEARYIEVLLYLSASSNI